MDQVTLKRRRVHDSPPPRQSGISFRHPGYRDLSDVLFELPRLDTSPQTERAGVHYGTALLACQIVANNSFHGYLATDRDGQQRVSLTLDGVLLEDNYWFIVPVTGDSAESVYPVVSRFEEWRFPHNHMGSLRWDPEVQPLHESTDHLSTPTSTTETSSNLPPTSFSNPPSTSVIPFAPPPMRPISRCILSSDAYAMEKAHIVPTAQSKWFKSNDMIWYGDKTQFIHTEANIVPMRQDLHKLWDGHIFALVPKRGDFVVHVLRTPTLGLGEFARKWHNTPVGAGTLDHAAKAMLFAKFAQAVLMLLKPFIAFSSVDRYVVAVEAMANPRSPAKMKAAWVSSDALSQQYSGGGSRSASTSSRKRSQSRISSQEALRHFNAFAQVDHEDGSNDGSADKDDWCEEIVGGRVKRIDHRRGEVVEYYDDGCYYSIRRLDNREDEEDEEERGRPRKRQRREQREHTVDTLPSLTDTSAVGDLEGHVSSDPIEPPSLDHTFANEDLPVKHTAKG
ncbi:unnamed protein product [Discula destructiva]